MRFRALAAVAALLMAGCATPGQGASSASSPAATPECRTGVEFEPAACGSCPWTDGCPVPALDDPLEVQLFAIPAPGESGGLEVMARNLGERSFHYNSAYAACDLSYHTPTGRQFLVPPGTHCDLMSYAVLKPGETARLFTWMGDECVRDAWGCAETRGLPPGDYQVRGRFCLANADGGPDCDAGWTAGGGAVSL